MFDLQAEFEDNHYQSLRPAATFSGEYSGGDSNVFQAAHSTYERISPVDAYHDVAGPGGASGGEEATISSYSAIQTTDGGAQVIPMSAVDSSSLQQVNT